MKAVVWASALAACGSWGAEAPGTGGEEAAPDGGAEPEKIDLVYERLGVQRRTLEAVVQIVTQLEAVADQSEAAQELLSEQGDPTERLKRALDEVVSGRRGHVGDGAVTAPVVVEAQPSDPEEAAGAAGRKEVAVEVVYAQLGDGGAGRVVVAVGGAHYAAAVGQRIRAGEDVVEILRIRADDGGALSVTLRVNGGSAVQRRVRS